MGVNNIMINEKIKDYFRFEEINTDKNTDDVEVTVWCTTYNHIEYIEKALEGFVNQETTFNYEVIVFDDASTDGTADVIRKYASEYPNIIKAYLAKENTFQKPQQRLMRTKLKNSVVKGKYIALCEGDDYWIYTKKLQRQYDLLEKYKEMVMCFHNAIRVNGDDVMPQIIDMDTGVVDDDEIFMCKNGRPPTASFFYRADVAKDLINSNAYLECPVGDDPLRHFMNAKGKIIYIDKCWSVRNYMHEGSWNRRFKEDRAFVREYQKKFYKYFEKFDKETKYAFADQICKQKLELCAAAFYSEFTADSTQDCMEYAKSLSKEFGESPNKYFYKLALTNANKYDDYIEYIRQQKSKKYIYGAGVEANKTAERLLKEEIDIEGFVVTSLEANPESIMEKKVIEFNKEMIDDSVFFVLGLNDFNRSQVIDLLIEFTVNII